MVLLVVMDTEGVQLFAAREISCIVFYKFDMKLCYSNSLQKKEMENHHPQSAERTILMMKIKVRNSLL